MIFNNFKNEKMKKTKIKSSLFTLLFMGLLTLSISCVDNEEIKPYQYPEHFLEGFSPTSGVPGTSVTITGTDFGDYSKAVTVYFNGIATTEDDIVSVTDNQMVVKVPQETTEGSGNIEVKVWTYNKTTESDFTVLPSATYDRIEPAEGKPGDELTIYGENFGDDQSQVSVLFKSDITAEIISFSSTEIKVIVPEEGITGPISVKIGVQELVTQAFSYPLVGLNFMFDEAGNNEGWEAGNNSTYEVSNGSFNASFDMSAAKRRADLKLTGGGKINVGGFPILAIKLNKPQSGNFILDTNFGSYKNGSNNWEGIIHGDIYYYDLRSTFGSSNTLSLTEDTEFSTFQFKIADIITDETGYSVDWIRSFESINALKEFTELPNGKFSYHFNDPNPTEYWVGKQGANNIIEDGKLKVTFAAGQSKRRADLSYIEGATFPADSPNGLWRYSEEYPILALKIAFTGTGLPTVGTGNIKLDRFNGAQDNAYLTDFVSDNVIYYDCSIDGGFTESQDLASFTLKIADITSTEETGYEVDWIQSFKTVQELQAYIESH